MATRLPTDRRKRLPSDGSGGHNRWHPDIPALLSVSEGEEITVEVRDSLDGRITRASSAADLVAIGDVDHPLTGPIHVSGAEPGDVLEVEVLDVEVDDFGFATISPGWGVLGELFSEPYLTHWEIEGDQARSQQLPGVTVPASPFPGIVGVAPSRDAVVASRDRERALAEHDRRILEPMEDGAVPPLAADGLRTCPPRENGGNLDVRQITAGSRAFLPVQVPGALLSIGDLHFSQGDGECCGSALEVAGAVTVRVRVHEGPWRNLPKPYLLAPTVGGRDSLITTGVAETGDRGPSMDLSLAARHAVGDMVEKLVGAFGFERGAAAVLCSVAADLRLSQVINVPNPVVSAVLPLDIFDEPGRLDPAQRPGVDEAT